ncbi:CAP domain-containing protein [Mycobacterium vicinigordonae]|uniref:CAP domain-containing protein n=1 Tax=Mycobacterium vicinigordonae TaxID=1719132 RepID=A0A7D6E2B1_9MYCO|nr:CAP domain-containing protein [Mycobacterium vicinigordonae]QLL10404.1 CAP domain-containing protein [Mycobacterium vicinigordonae]
MIAALLTATAGPAHADNKRLNDGVVSNVYTVQHRAGCSNDIRISPPLQLAAQWHTQDVLNNRNLDGDIGSDNSGPQDRAARAGFSGKVGETVAISPALAISGIEVMNQWFGNPAAFGTMSDCANNRIGVWSESVVDRTVVVAVYGQEPASSGVAQITNGPVIPPPPPVISQNLPPDPSPDYDASDELEYALDWLPWALRGVRPPPGYPAQ